MSTRETQKNTNTPLIILGILFTVMFLWWLASYMNWINVNPLIWGALYQSVAWLGIIYGFIASNRWGGYKSLLGRSLFFFTLGLLLQVFGQSAFSYYNLFLHVDIPYPSIADIGYFGSIPMYIYGAWLLLKVSGGSFALREKGYRFIAYILPLGIVGFSYYYFAKSASFDINAPVQTLLDFGYPLGQAFYVSLALVVYLTSRKYLGGLLKQSVTALLIALVVQYAADYNFLYQAMQETWTNGGYGDLLYMLAYFVMAVALLQLGSVYKEHFKE